MRSITLRQHRFALKPTAQAPKQTRAHTLAAVLGRGSPNPQPVSLATPAIPTLAEIEAKYGPIPTTSSARPRHV